MTWVQGPGLRSHLSHQHCVTMLVFIAHRDGRRLAHPVLISDEWRRSERQESVPTAIINWSSKTAVESAAKKQSASKSLDRGVLE
jgi:hypothetical protein